MSSADMPPEISRLRVPPHSLEAEQALLGALMMDMRRIDEVREIVAEGDIYRHEHRLIFAAILRLDQRCKEVDVLTVHLELGDASVSLAYLNSLAEAAPSTQAVRYAKVVADRAASRRLIALTEEACATAWRVSDSSQAADEIAAMMAGVDRPAAGRAPRLLGDLVALRTEYLQQLEAGEIKSGWSLGLPTLDRMLGGGLRAGGVYIVAARPGIGKSSLAQQFATTAARAGHTTLMLSQEMQAGEIADRAIAHLGRVDYADITHGELRNHWGAILDVAETLRDCPLWIDDEEALTLRKVTAKARSVRGLRVLVVDYLQLMKADGGPKGEANRNAEIESISRGMKALAKQLNIAVVLLSQLNRQVEQRAVKKPMCADLRDSGAIEQDADVVLLLWTHREVSDGVRIVGVHVDKNRQGRKGEVALHFDGSVQRWAESTESLSAEPSKHQRGNSL